MKNVFQKISTVKEIEDAVREFQPCFPHLKDKINCVHSYAVKLNQFAEVCLLLSDDNKIGLSVFYMNDMNERCGYISLIGIKSQYQKHHLGGTLLLYTLQEMKDNGMEYAKLEVDNDNKNAYEFYKHMGFDDCESASMNSMYLVKRI